MDGKLKEIADNYYTVTSVNDFDNSRDCEVLKHKYFMLGCELIYKEMSASQKSSTSESALPISDVRRSADMITEQFEYRGFTFQRMTKDSRWYVCYENQIVNWGQYQNDLKEWVDGHYA